MLELNSLPIFPLDAVLFEGGILPLRIFEVRYLDMIGKCHQMDAPFGVVTLTKGKEVIAAGEQNLEQFQPVGTIARVKHLERPQAGLMLVQCVGEQRFSIRSSQRLKNHLWVADVSLIRHDTPQSVPPELENVSRLLRKVHDNLRVQNPSAPLPPAGQGEYDDCAWVANRWCELLPIPLDTRYSLMSLDSPLLRLELVSDLLEKSAIG